MTDTEAGFHSTGLPVSRDERFYTATVLPALISSGSFAGLETFWSTVSSAMANSDTATGLGAPVSCASGLEWGVQLLAEFDLWKAAGDPKTRARFPDPPPIRAVPDLTILVNGSPPVLIVVEAKMFHYFTAAELRSQMDAQQVLMTYVASRLGLHKPASLAQIALIPKVRLNSLPPTFPYPVITWELVRDAFGSSDDQSVQYWVHVLETALKDGHFSTPAEFGGHSDDKRAGKEILAAHLAGALGYTVIGRRGGLGGKEFTSDLVTGRWMKQRYEVAEDDALAGQPNWFTVEEFVGAVRRRWLDVGGLQERLRAFAEERDWGAFHDPKNLSMALAAEVGELLEVFRWLTPAQSQALAKDPEKANESAAAREEIADTLILLLQLADALDVDLQGAVEAKIELNAERYPASTVKGDATKYTRRRD